MANDVQMNIRIPAELRESLERAARENGRSMTAELVVRLQSTFSSIEAEMLASRMSELARLDAALQMALADQRVWLHRFEIGDLDAHEKRRYEFLLKQVHERINRLNSLRYQLVAAIGELAETSSD